jgi:hypothetical protein
MNTSDTTHNFLQIVPTETAEYPGGEHARRLTELVGAMDEPQAFKRGQFVRWKAGLRNRALPAYNEAAIVREVLSVPVYDGCEAARCANSPFFGEPLTLVLAVVDSDGDLCELRYDARRFETYDVSG